MSFFPNPSSLQSPDEQAHREEALTTERQQQQHSTNQNTHSATAAVADNSHHYTPTENLLFLRHTVSGPAAASPTLGSSTWDRRHVVTPDPVAFRYLQEDKCVRVVERRLALVGYELYLVEQWACSRQSPTIVITTYTGDPNHTVMVGVLSIPADQHEWSARLCVYFQAMQQYHARPKDTPFGELMATNLSSFPSALTVIAVPDGDTLRHRQDFIVNEDLKRLGCSGRSGLTLLPPTRATQDKFQSLYKTSDRIPFAESVVELIRMCQVALYLFGLLEPWYLDGLLCDVTEKALNDWWAEVGAEYYHNEEPADGILGPTTVAALLGLLMGARNRLAWYGAPVSKDVFDLDNMKKGIGAFQKACCKMTRERRSRRLDHQTLRKLHTVTAKAAAGDVGWGVQKAVKSTVEGFGGKRGELVIGMVGGKDKANIGDIETLDIDKFISLVHGDRAKWLWRGKQRRALASGGGGMSAVVEADSLYERPDRSELMDEEEPMTMATPGQHQRWAQSDPSREADGTAATTAAALTGADMTLLHKEDLLTAATSTTVYSGNAPGSAISVMESPGERDRDPRRKTVLKSVADKVSDARSGLGLRIWDAVGGGRRGHTSRISRDELGSSGSGSGGGGGNSGGYMAATTTATTIGTATATATAIPFSHSHSVASSSSTPGIAALVQSPTALSSPTMMGRAFTWKNRPEEYLQAFRQEKEWAQTAGRLGVKLDIGGEGKEDEDQEINQEQQQQQVKVVRERQQQQQQQQKQQQQQQRQKQQQEQQQKQQIVQGLVAAAATAASLPGIAPLSNRKAQRIRREIDTTADTSIAGSLVDEADLEGPILEAERNVGTQVAGLLRRHSIHGTQAEVVGAIPAAVRRYDEVWPRRLSFSLAEEAVLGWTDVAEVGGGGQAPGSENNDNDTFPVDCLTKYATALSLERRLYQQLALLKDGLGPLLLGKVEALEALQRALEQQTDSVQGIFFQLSAGYEQVQESSQEVIGMERSQATEALREVEMLMAKVEYEMGALATKVQDMEDGVRQFSEQVEDTERQADELQQQLATESWLHWCVRSLTGIGTGPNIIGG